MPVEFLSDVHLERYGRFQGDPTPFQLAEYFVLTLRDLGAMDDLRHFHTRLGFALQLCTLRFLSTFLLDPTEVPVRCYGPCANNSAYLTQRASHVISSGVPPL